MSLTVLRLNTPDTDRVIAGIEAEVARAPKLFSGLPVLIDLNRHRVDIAQVADIARNQGLVPVAVVDADDDSAASARACGLGVLQQAALDSQASRPRSDERPAARIVDQPGTRFLGRAFACGNRPIAQVGSKKQAGLECCLLPSIFKKVKFYTLGPSQ